MFISSCPVSHVLYVGQLKSQVTSHKHTHRQTHVYTLSGQSVIFVLFMVFLLLMAPLFFSSQWNEHDITHIQIKYFIKVKYNAIKEIFKVGFDNQD